MSQQHRRNFNCPGHAHELTFSCYHGLPLLARDRTRRWFLDTLDQARTDHDFAVIAYVIMPEHVHLLLWPRREAYDMAEIRRTIKQPVARRAMRYLERHAPHWLERLTRRRGERMERLFWQSGGGYDRNVTDRATLRVMVDYIHANPVRRALAARPVDWPWSSARWYAGDAAAGLVMDPWPL